MSRERSQLLMIVLLVMALILVLALTASIVLVFTLHKCSNNSKQENQSSIIFLREPCECGCPTIRPQVSGRIIRGEAAFAHSWPWQLLLVNYTSEGKPGTYCGATLISPKHVLTAAHCVFGVSPRYIVIIARLHMFNVSTWSSSARYRAERIYTHESYDDQTGADDIAVIRLRTAIPLDEYVSPVCLAAGDNVEDEKLTPGEELIATGWGALERVNRTLPTVLQQVRLKFVSQLDPLCGRLIGFGESIRVGQMCAGFPPRAVCFGDSGGPLVRSIVHSNGQTYWQQVGIMSWTVDCGSESKYPDVYTRVSHYHWWIVDKLRASP